MKNIFLMAVCLFFQCPSLVHAEESNKKFSYCGGNLKFYVPSFLDKKSIEKQSIPVACKYSLTLKSKLGNKHGVLDIRQSSDFFVTDKDITTEYLTQLKNKYPIQLHTFLTQQQKNGAVTIITLYWFDADGLL